MVPSHRSAVPKPQTPEQVFAAAIVALVLGVILFLVTYKVYKAIVKLHANHSITATTTAVTVAARVGVGAGADDEVEGEVEGEHEHGHDGHHIEMDDCEFFSLTLSSQHPHTSTDWSVVRFSLPPRLMFSADIQSLTDGAMPIYRSDVLKMPQQISTCPHPWTPLSPIQSYPFKSTKVNSSSTGIIAPDREEGLVVAEDPSPQQE